MRNGRQFTILSNLIGLVPFRDLYDSFVTHPDAPVMTAYEPFRCSSKVLDSLILAELRELFKDRESVM
jgi:hypothetical protein